MGMARGPGGDNATTMMTLGTEGPGMTEGKMEKFKEVIEFKSDNHRVLTSHMLGEDETWYGFMRANYRRK